jgi:hypothetical protein
MRTRRSYHPRPGLPASVRTTRERQELLVSHGIVAVLQLGIAVALAVAAAQTYRMWRHGVPYIPASIARMVPVFLLLGVVMALLAASRSLRRVRTIHRLPLEAPREP